VVGQDLVKLELGGASRGGDKESAPAEPKEAASSDQPTSLGPEVKKDDSPPPSPPPPPPTTITEKKAFPLAQEQPKKDSTTSKGSPNSTRSAPTLGSREERRVCINVTID